MIGGIIMFDKDKANFYDWLQRELERELKKIYRIYRIGVFGDRFIIWFLNNDNSLSIPLNVMKEIYDSEKSMEKLTSIIESEYVAKIKK